VSSSILRPKLRNIDVLPMGILPDMQSFARMPVEMRLVIEYHVD
jgi:hypothetical protein